MGVSGRLGRVSMTTPKLASSFVLTAMTTAFMTLSARTASLPSETPVAQATSTTAHGSSEAARDVGAACAANRECSGGTCIQAEGWADGYCAATCKMGACSASEACVTLADHSAFCLRRCGAESSCRAAYVCNATVGVCLPDCRAGWSCGPSLTCDVQTGECSAQVAGLDSP